MMRRVWGLQHRIRRRPAWRPASSAANKKKDDGERVKLPVPSEYTRPSNFGQGLAASLRLVVTGVASGAGAHTPASCLADEARRRRARAGWSRPPSSAPSRAAPAASSSASASASSPPCVAGPAPLRPARALPARATTQVALPANGVLRGVAALAVGAASTPGAVRASRAGQEWDAVLGQWVDYDLDRERQRFCTDDAESLLKQHILERKEEAKEMLKKLADDDDDDEDDDDDDDDGPKKSKAAPAKEKVKDMALYDSLGVAPDAAEGAIKKAYYKAALSCHPDKHPGDLKAKEAFQKISTAYAVLSDPVARQRYDSKGSVDPAKAGPGTSQFYAMVFGSDAFVRYVGELRIASMFQKAAAGDDGDDDDEPDTAEAEFRQAKRAVTLATTLRDDLEPFLKGEMDAAALAQRSRAVADALASTSLGATLVRVIAHVYKASAARHSPGAGAAVQKARDFTHLMGTRLEALVAGAASVGAAHRMRRAVGSEAAAAAADDGVPLSKAVCLVVTDAGGDWACRAFARKPDAEAHFKQLPYTRAAVLFSRAPAAGRRAAGEWKAERRYGIGYATRALVDAVAAAPGDATTRGLNTRRLKAIQGEMVGSVFAVGWRMSVVDVEATLGSAISKLFRDAGRDASKRQRLGEGLAVVGDAFLKAADASKHEASVLEQLLAHEFGKMEQQGAKKGAKGRPR